MSDETPRKKIDVRSMIQKAAADTREVMESTIMAPLIPGAKVRVRINGIVCELKPDDQRFAGWALMKPNENGTAQVIGPAPLAQVKQFQSMLPRFHLVMVMEAQGSWWAVAANSSDARMQISGAVQVCLADRISSFDTVWARFDGASFWFEELARRRNPVVARKLRESLAQEVFPEDLVCPEMTPQERFAYAIVFYEQRPELLAMSQPTPGSAPNSKSARPVLPTFNYEEWFATTEAGRLQRAVQHAGARLDAYWRDGGTPEAVTVRMMVDGETHVVTVNSGNFGVISSGICLSGRDHEFDLASLVSVFRQHRFDDEY